MISWPLCWETGRQGGGYRKMLLARGRAWDCYFIDYPKGAGVRPHKDHVPGKRHFRLNVVLWGECDKLELNDGGALFMRVGPVVLFRPDLVEHSVRPVARRRIVFSIGWVRDSIEGCL